MVVAHRIGWLTGLMEVTTWLGSAAAIIPLAFRLAVLAVVAGAIGPYNIVKHRAGRRRPVRHATAPEAAGAATHS